MNFKSSSFYRKKITSEYFSYVAYNLRKVLVLAPDYPGLSMQIRIGDYLNYSKFYHPSLVREKDREREGLWEV